MGSRAVVAVTGSDHGSRSAWLFSRFLLGLFGVKARFVHPASWRKDMHMDGLLLLGGVDIDPRTYGGGGHHSVTKTEPHRDEMELALLERAIDFELPIMGICRGMQLINHFFGGTLHPHIHDFELEVPHPHTPFPLKRVTIEPKSHLYTILNHSTLIVNALHHQAVDRMGNGLQKAAHDLNGIVQAIESIDKKFLYGFQWHPEFMPYQWHSRKIFHTFAEETKRTKKEGEF